jgi:hypothetical protein
LADEQGIWAFGKDFTTDDFIITSSHPHIITSSHHHIITSSHPHIITTPEEISKETGIDPETLT